MHPTSRLRRRLRAGALCAAVLCCAAASTTAADGDGVYPGDLGQAIATILVFGVLLFVLGRFAWKPILRQIHDRERSMARSLEQAEQRETKARALLKTYEERLAKAEEDARDVLDRSRREAADAREQMLAETRRDARQTVAEAQREIERAKRDAVADLQTTTAELATEVAEQLLRRDLNDEDRRRLMDASLEEIRRRHAEQGV